MPASAPIKQLEDQIEQSLSALRLLEKCLVLNPPQRRVRRDVADLAVELMACLIKQYGTLAEKFSKALRFAKDAEQRIEELLREVEALKESRNAPNGPVFTYLLATPDKRRIKIGRTKHLQRRLSRLRYEKKQALELMAVVRGDVESSLHQRFKTHRIKGDWFHMHPEISGYIDTLLGEAGKQKDFVLLVGQAE